MAKLTRKIKVWFEHNGRVAGIVVLICAVLGVGIWHAATSNVDVVQNDFGDASLSELAHELSNLGYDDGVRLLDAGDEMKGRAVMSRLAPLNFSSKTPQGNGKAHLWLAKDLLAGKSFGFLSEYPLAAAGGKRLASPVELLEGDLTARCQLHLSSAVALNPELKEATVLLAEVLLAQNQRNEAIAVIQQSIGTNAQIDLSIHLANLQAYAGDDLGLEESSWHDFATLGREVNGRMRGETEVRMRYIYSGLMLKQMDLASAAIGKFERDFANTDDGATCSLQLQIAELYFKAVNLLADENFDQVRAAEYLLEAHRLQPGHEALVASLMAMVARFPELKAQLEIGIGSVSQQLEADDPMAAAGLHVLLAELNASNASAHLQKSYQLSPDTVEVLIKLAENALDSGGSLTQVEEALAEQVNQGGHKKYQQYQLMLVWAKFQLAKQDWRGALDSLERALATKQTKHGAELHSLLAQVYAELGLNILADEHRNLAGE